MYIKILASINTVYIARVYTIYRGRLSRDCRGVARSIFILIRVFFIRDVLHARVFLRAGDRSIMDVRGRRLGPRTKSDSKFKLYDFKHDFAIE